MTPATFTQKVQQRLRDRGEYTGKIDGAPGNLTNAAFDSALPGPVQGLNKTIEESADDSLVRFQAVLDKAGVRYFNAAEVFYLGGSNARLKLNTYPPSIIWQDITPLLLVLDELREVCGPLFLTSVYRNRKYNTAIGGATASTHMRFVAADVVPSRVSPAVLATHAHTLRDRGRFKGGVGRYSTFVHVDTRGYNVDF